MIDEGITSFKLYMTYPAMIVDDCDLYKILKNWYSAAALAGVHCENAGVIDALIAEAKKEGRLGPGKLSTGSAGYHGGRGCSQTIGRLEADVPVMIVHLTNKKAYEEVMAAREKGQTVYAETCPQYLLLEDSVYSKPDFEGAVYVCAPPIRKKKIRTVCGKHLEKKKFRLLLQTSAASA